MELVLVVINLFPVFAVHHYQDYHRGCRLWVEYRNSTCLQIQNQNISECALLNSKRIKDGHVLGYCDSITYIDRNPTRIPEFIFHKECRPECNRSCAAQGYYWCTQVFSHIQANIKGSIIQTPVKSDCLCTKNTRMYYRMNHEYEE